MPWTHPAYFLVQRHPTVILGRVDNNDLELRRKTSPAIKLAVQNATRDVIDRIY